MTENAKTKYVWVRGDRVQLIDDPTSVYRSSDYNPTVDRFYQLGPEVKIKLVVETMTESEKPKSPVWRSTPGEPVQ